MFRFRHPLARSAAPRFGLFVLLLGGLAFFGFLRADAASNAVCDKTSVKVVWEGNDWTSSEKSTAMSGFRVWSWDVDKYNGSQPVTISETSGSQIVNVDWAWQQSSSYGSGNCNTGQIVFNSTKRTLINSNTAEFKKLAAHEMGHAIGLDHVHRKDSLGGDNPPVMWACGWNDGGTYRLTQDDHAAMQIQTDVSGAYRSATANSSFEEDGGYMEFWGIKSGSITYRITGGVDGTPYYLKFMHNNAESYIFSTTRLIDDPRIDWVKARANYIKDVSTDTGNVKVMLRVREYNVATPACGYPGRRSGSYSFAAARYYPKYCTPTTTWKYCDTSGENPPHVAAGHGGIEVRVYVYNRMFRASGSRALVGVDRVRVLANY